MKILLAGPETGKTTKIKQIIADEFPKVEKIKVISALRIRGSTPRMLSVFFQSENILLR